MIHTTPSTPRALRDVSARGHRMTLLSQPHIAPLIQHALELRLNWGDVPFFDPFDGGTNARVLFLLEKPGPMASSSGFISRDNNDPTAEAVFRFMQEAGIPRPLSCIWNVVPGWNGTLRISGPELCAGVGCVEALVDLLPHLRVIVLVGKKAHRAEALLQGRAIPVLKSWHPSPINRAAAPDKWRSIPEQWRAASRLACSDAP